MAEAHCPNCDYNLTGLDLPRRCPECGYLADPDAEREAAVRWYVLWSGLVFRKPPAMALVYVGDVRCRRQAWRRWLLLALAPWLAVTLLFLLFNSIQVIKTHETWWEKPENPGRKLNHDETTDWDRLLGFNFDLDFRFFALNHDLSDVTGATRYEKTSRSFELGWPEPDFVTWLCFLIPPAIGVAGVVFLAAALRVFRVATRRTAPGIGEGAALPLATLRAPWLAVALLMHLASAICLAMTEITLRSTDPWERTFGGLILAALGAYALGGVLVAWRTVRVSRPSRRGLFIRVPFALLSIAWLGAVAGVWLLTVRIVELFD